MGSIPAAAVPTALTALNKHLPLVDMKTGQQTQITNQTLERWRSFVTGAGRLIPCAATTSNTNVITLTPNTASPTIEGYKFGDCYPFWADATSTGSVTATVVPKSGTLPTLNVYLQNGNQAGSGDVIQNQLYLPLYLPIANAGAGGLVLVGINPAAQRVRSASSFQCAAAATTVVSDTATTAASTIILTPSNASAATLQGSVKSLYVSSLSAGASFTVATANAAAAAGTEHFYYVIIG